MENTTVDYDRMIGGYVLVYWLVVLVVVQVVLVVGCHFSLNPYRSDTDEPACVKNFPPTDDS